MRSSRNGIWLGLSMTDCVTIATIGAAFGVIAVLNEPIVHLMSAILGPYAGMALVGLFHTPGIIAFRLIGKPWAAFTCQNLFGIVQVLLGNPSGFVTLWFTSFESVGQEAVFRVLPRRLALGFTGLCAAGIASLTIALIPEYFIYGLENLAWWAWLAPKLAVGIPSVLIFAYGLSAAAIALAPEARPPADSEETERRPTD